MRTWPIKNLKRRLNFRQLILWMLSLGSFILMITFQNCSQQYSFHASDDWYPNPSAPVADPSDFSSPTESSPASPGLSNRTPPEEALRSDPDFPNLQCSPKSDCISGASLKTDTNEFDPKKLTWTPAFNITPDKTVHFLLAPYKAIWPGATLECSFNNVIFACEDEFTFTAPSTEGTGILRLKIQLQGQTASQSAFRISFQNLNKDLFPIYPELPFEWGSDFYLEPYSMARVSQEPNHIWVDENATLAMLGRNFCIHRTTSDLCSLVIGNNAQLLIRGSNVAVWAPRAHIYLASTSKLLIFNSDFKSDLFISPGAIVMNFGSSFHPPSVQKLTENFQVNLCPFFRYGSSCPENLKVIHP